MRGARQNFLYSKIMLWVALDRGLRLADKRSLPAPNRNNWIEQRDLIYEEVMTRGWNAEKQVFCMSYETRDDAVLDSSVLIMPLWYVVSSRIPSAEAASYTDPPVASSSRPRTPASSQLFARSSVPRRRED